MLPGRGEGSHLLLHKACQAGISLGLADGDLPQAGKDYHAGKYNSYSGNNTDSGFSYSSSDYSSWDSNDTDWDSDW